ncbi:hypothetical protein ACN6A1_25385 [Myxococcus virescens]|uniref:hypothetical protein n=1 Tax=Myxococcus virescens TaxID=83456 RepID=UPI003DA5400B
MASAGAGPSFVDFLVKVFIERIEPTDRCLQSQYLYIVPNEHPGRLPFPLQNGPSFIALSLAMTACRLSPWVQ